MSSQDTSQYLMFDLQTALLPHSLFSPQPGPVIGAVVYEGDNTGFYSFMLTSSVVMVDERRSGDRAVVLGSLNPADV